MRFLVLFTILYIIFISVSFAGNVTVTEVVTSGSLTLTLPNNFSMTRVTLGGSSTVDSDNNDANYIVEDARGTGAGWNLTFTASQFRTADSVARTISADNFYMRVPQSSITKIWGQDIDVTYGPTTLRSTDTNVQGTGIKYVTAQAGYGMGKYSMALVHRLVIPIFAVAGTYTSTITATLNAEP